MKDIYNEIADAYVETRSQGEAIERVKDICPDADANELWDMWAAIDAYVVRCAECE